MPVLPPTEESTCASSEVGIWMKFMPRRTMPAAKPARSPITPPPSAMTASPRSSRAARTRSHHILRRCEALGLLAGRQDDSDIADAGRVEAGGQSRKMRGSDVLVGDDSSADPWQARCDLAAGARDQAVADQDVVGTLAEPDIDGRQRGTCCHAAAPSIAARRSTRASITSSAITSLRSSRVSTVTSAVA